MTTVDPKLHRDPEAGPALPEEVSAGPALLSSRSISTGVELARAFPIPEGKPAFVPAIPDESPRITIEEFRRILMSCVMTGASDITIQSDQQVRAMILGRLYRVTRRPWSPSEIDAIFSETYGNTSAQTEINGRNILDYSYELNLGNGQRQRFRVNATGILGRDDAGVEITLRALPSKTPTIEQVSISRSELASMSPREGIVIIAGATGSGKSTTMAAITRHHLEEIDVPVKIVDIQAPIEFTFRDVMTNLSGSASTIGQSEVGRHINSFAAGVHSSLRRNPNIINVGEARDYDTISAALEVALTGHLVYTTTHAGSVVDAIRRIMSFFPAGEREARGYDLISGLRFLMVQHLVTRIDRPGRIAVREYLEFTPDIREEIIVRPVSEWPSTLISIMARTFPEGSKTAKKSLFESIMPLYRAGIISKHDAITVGEKPVARAILESENV